MQDCKSLHIFKYGPFASDLSQKHFVYTKQEFFLYFQKR